MLKQHVAQKMANGRGVCPNFICSILLSHLEVNWSQITTLPRYRYTLHQHVWKFPEIHGCLKEDHIQIQLFSKHGCEGLSEHLKYTSCVTELIKNIRTENMNQQIGACGHLLQQPPQKGQVEEKEEEEILFTVNYEEQKSYTEKVFCRGDIIFCHSVM